jgi:tetratricopeptide (TPR) repeat protein
MRRRRGEAWPTAGPLDYPLLAWLAVTALTAPFSVNLRASFEAVWITLTNILILTLLIDAIRRGWGSALWRSLYLLAGVTFLLSMLEMLAWYSGLPLFPGIEEGWLSIGGLSAPIPPVLHRLSYALMTSTALSGFVALLIPPVLCTLPAARDRDTRIALLLWLGGAGLTLFLALSRNGFLALGVSVVVIAGGSFRSPQFRRWWGRLPSGVSRFLVPLVIVATLALTIGLGFFLATRLADHGSGDAVRLDLWRSALEMFRDHPLTGVGPNAYGTALRRYRNPLLAREHVNQAHNVYLEAGTEMGIPGLIIGGWVLLALTWAWWRRWRAQSPGTSGWWRTLGIGAALVGLAARSLVESFFNSAIVLPTLLFVALILASPREREDPQRMEWRWVAAAIGLGVGVLVLAWDSWGYVHFTRSVSALGKGETEAALSAVRRAREIDPWMPLYACHNGYLHGLQAGGGEPAARSPAIDQYDTCLQQLPALAHWVDQLNYATLLWQAGRPADARDAVEAATVQTPTESTPWLNRGYWAEETGDLEEAAWSYGWALSLNPQLASSPFWQQGERPAMWDQILAAGQEALTRRHHEEDVLTQWHWEVTVAHGDWEAVVPDLEAWLTTRPNDAESMAWLGKALLDLDRPEEAFVWLERAVSLDPSRVWSHILRGEAALTLGYYEEAEESFRTALLLQPTPRAHLGLARHHHVRGQTREALDEYSQALQFPVVTHTTDRVLYRRTGWAVPLPQVLQIAPRYNGEAALEWGALLEKAGDPEKAQRVYQVALNADPFFEEIRQRITE